MSASFVITLVKAWKFVWQMYVRKKDESAKQLIRRQQLEMHACASDG